jgi:hypothetical protein
VIPNRSDALISLRDYIWSETFLFDRLFLNCCKLLKIGIDAFWKESVDERMEGGRWEAARETERQNRR